MTKKKKYIHIHLPEVRGTLNDIFHHSMTFHSPDN